MPRGWAAIRPRLIRFAGQDGKRLDAWRGRPCLTHSDFGGSNILMQRAAPGWTVAAVIDWEYAFSGRPFSISAICCGRRWANSAGTRPLCLQVSVTEFKGQNAAATIFIGGSELIKGSAQVIDPASNEIVGDYDITHSMGGGGLIAAAAMSGSERKLTIGFAGQVCEKVFGRTPASH